MPDQPADPAEREVILHMATIDRILIEENGTTKTLTPAEWKQLPLPQRVKMLGGAAKFFAGSEAVPAKLAIAQLK